MPVDTGAESVGPASDPPPAVPVDTDAILAAVLDALREPLAQRIAEGVAGDRHSERNGGHVLPPAERAQQIASSAISDCEYALREIGNRPTRGERLVRQYGARLAERTVRKYLLSLEVSPDSVDVAVAMLHNEEASSDRFRAATQLAAYREPVDPPMLQPVQIPIAKDPDHA